MKEKTINRIQLIASVLCGVGAAYLIIHNIPKVFPAPQQTASEFVCETDGELSERHVGVKSAELWESNTWTIRYVDGDGGTRYYLQQPGETCAVEASPISGTP